LRVFYVGGELEPASGWMVFSLLPAESEESPSGEAGEVDPASV